MSPQATRMPREESDAIAPGDRQWVHLIAELVRTVAQAGHAHRKCGALPETMRSDAMLRDAFVRDAFMRVLPRFAAAGYAIMRLDASRPTSELTAAGLERVEGA